MGAVIFFPKFLRKRQCIRWSCKKQNGSPRSPPVETGLRLRQSTHGRPPSIVGRGSGGGVLFHFSFGRSVRRNRRRTEEGRTSTKKENRDRSGSCCRVGVNWSGISSSSWCIIGCGHLNTPSPSSDPEHRCCWHISLCYFWKWSTLVGNILALQVQVR